MKKTLYELLGVQPNASQNEIHAAYKRLQAALDPDLPKNRGNPEAEIQRKIMTEAYLVLSDPARRSSYDASLVMRTLDTPPEKEPRSKTNRILILSLIGLIAFAVINQAIVQWRALQLSEAVLERNEGFSEEVAERERRQTLGDAGGAETEEMRERRLQREEEERQRQIRQAEEKQKREMEEARRYGARIAAEVAQTEAAARRQAEYERQRQEQQQRADQERQEREALARLEREKQRLRELELQNRR
jgi:curved DNA-binding protein CbpA